jgi:hypothetical protein
MAIINQIKAVVRVRLKKKSVSLGNNLSLMALSGAGLDGGFGMLLPYYCLQYTYD